jgi:hypothetical protein
LILSRTLRKRKGRKNEMKKLSLFFFFAAVFVFFSFSLVIFAQDKSKKPDISKAELQERINANNKEREAINALKDKFSKRKDRYDTKCQDKTFDLNDKNQEKIANECQEESEWLINNSKIIKERQKKHKEDYDQIKSEIDALKKARGKTKGK